jgi:diguanylate cyclase (GGDEF)-like protein
MSSRHGKKATVIWIDLDKYKKINDTHGHRVGDEVLCEVARRLQGCLRKSDSVARVGGDELSVLAQDLTGQDDAERVPATILSAFTLPFELPSHQVVLTASLGISMFPEHGEDPITLLRNADMAVYSAKRAGGGTFRMFRSSLNDSLQRKLLLERELKTAIDRNELTLEFQPLLDRNAIWMAWKRCCAGIVPRLATYRRPSLFRIAEAAGLIPSIGEWVTRTACRNAAH